MKCVTECDAFCRMSPFSYKFRCQVTKIPIGVARLLLLDGSSTTLHIPRHHLRAHSTSRLLGSCLANLNEHRNTAAFQTKLLSTMAGTILVQARDPAKLAMEIQSSLDERRLDDAWKFYEQHMHMDGFPRKSVVNQLLGTFAESQEVEWLEKAFGLVKRACEEGKQSLLGKETLIYLSFSLARASLPVPASTVLRNLIEMDQFPPVAAWSAIVAHISQTASGAYLSAELVQEIGYLFQDSRVDPRKKSNDPLIAMKPNAVAFSITLAGCVLFGTTRKAEQLIEMMPRVGVKMDLDLLIAMAHVYERNGRREELAKLERCVNEARDLTEIQLRQFQSCLLSCHLKLGDLDSASRMVLEMLRKAKTAQSSRAATSLAIDRVVNERKSSLALSCGLNLSHIKPLGLEDDNGTGLTRTPMISYHEYSKDRKFIKLETEAKEILGGMLSKLRTQVELLTAERGIIQPTEEIFAKLVKAFLESGKTKDLAEFLIKVERESTPVSNDDSILVHVVNSCVSIGWLERAHDLLDEMRMAGVRATGSTYSSLLRAYCQANRAGDAAALLRDVKRAGVQLDSNCYQFLIQSKILRQDTQDALRLFKEMKEAKIPKTGDREFEKLIEGGSEAQIMGKLLEEIKGGQGTDCGVHDWNNVIHFFARKRLMGDAEKALKKMLSLGLSPNAQTFHSMVTGYAAVGGNYLEVTELWGEMKSLSSSTPVRFDQELLDSVLYVFVRGGFFGRANEVVEMMEKEKMFVDKYKYRTLFLKYHKTLYKGKAPKFQTESKLRKRDEALAFRKWVGLN